MSTDTAKSLKAASDVWQRKCEEALEHVLDVNINYEASGCLDKVIWFIAARMAQLDVWSLDCSGWSVAIMDMSDTEDPDIDRGLYPSQTLYLHETRPNRKPFRISDNLCLGVAPLPFETVARFISLLPRILRQLQNEEEATKGECVD